jgi:hypothetical protein
VLALLSRKPARTFVAGLFLLGAITCKQKAEEAPAPSFDTLPAPAIEELTVGPTKADLKKPDPEAAFWKDVPRGTIALTAQPLVNPRPETTTTEAVIVQAVHDGTSVAFRLVWSDPEESIGGRLGEFSDALALQFPSNGQEDTPVMMGGPDLPVHIYHWRAQYQRDEENGKPEMAALYPNMNVDMYPMDFKEAPGGTDQEKESFLPARALGNPQAYAKKAVDEIVAEGFGSSAVQDAVLGSARGLWKDGRWALVITRPLNAPERSVLQAPGENYLAFAIWQGGKDEVGSRKSVTMAWLPVKVQ